MWWPWKGPFQGSTKLRRYVALLLFCSLWLRSLRLSCLLGLGSLGLCRRRRCLLYLRKVLLGLCSLCTRLLSSHGARGFADERRERDDAIWKVSRAPAPSSPPTLTQKYEPDVRHSAAAAANLQRDLACRVSSTLCVTNILQILISRSHEATERLGCRHFLSVSSFFWLPGTKKNI